MNPIAFDTETTGLERSSRAFAFSMTEWSGATEVIRSPRHDYVAILDDLFSGQHLVVMHNAMYDLYHAGKILGRPVWREVEFVDTMILAKAMHFHYSYTLEDLCWDIFKYPKIDAEIHGVAHKLGGMHFVDPAEMHRYQVADGQRTMILYRHFLAKLEKESTYLRELIDTEYEVIRDSLDMQERGLVLDRGETAKLILRLRSTCRDLKAGLEVEFGIGFSPFRHEDRLRLADRLDIRCGSTPKGARSLKKDQLLEARELVVGRDREILDLFMQYQSYSRGISMVQGYARAAGHDNVIHPSLHTWAADTGRQSCSNPALQAVSKNASPTNPYPVPARHCFRPRPGYVILLVDKAGIELRLLVQFSMDPELVEAIRTGADPHALCAGVWYPEDWPATVDPDKCKELRTSGKNSTFALGYGAGADKLAVTLVRSQAFAQLGRMRMQERFPRLAFLHKDMADEAGRLGYVTTLYGRRVRVIDNYAATNYLIQGSAADLLKIAQVRIGALNRGSWTRCHVLLTIHDEVVIEYPEDLLPLLPEYWREVRKCMVNFPKVQLPLEAELSLVKTTWADKEEVVF